MKNCFKCRKEKELSEFYKHPKMKDGVLGKCKECAKLGAEQRRFIKQKDPGWVLSERKRHRIKSAKARLEGKHAKNDPAKKLAWEQRNMHKIQAVRKVNNAIRDGRLVKQCCEVCGKFPAQAHHDDYSKPLDVRWLCVPHHNEHHIREREKALLAKFNAA